MEGRSFIARGMTMGDSHHSGRFPSVLKGRGADNNSFNYLWQEQMPRCYPTCATSGLVIEPEDFVDRNAGGAVNAAHDRGVIAWTEREQDR